MRRVEDGFWNEKCNFILVIWVLIYRKRLEVEFWWYIWFWCLVREYMLFNDFNIFIL